MLGGTTLGQGPWHRGQWKSVCGAIIAKQSTTVYRILRYFFTVNAVDEILRTAHPYYEVSVSSKAAKMHTDTSLVAVKDGSIPVKSKVFL